MSAGGGKGANVVSFRLYLPTKEGDEIEVCSPGEDEEKYRIKEKKLY